MARAERARGCPVAHNSLFWGTVAFITAGLPNVTFDLWIGLHASQKDFQWVEQEPLLYTNWAPGEPSGPSPAPGSNIPVRRPLALLPSPKPAALAFTPRVSPLPASLLRGQPSGGVAQGQSCRGSSERLPPPRPAVRWSCTAPPLTSLAAGTIGAARRRHTASSARRAQVGVSRELGNIRTGPMLWVLLQGMTKHGP